MREYLLLNLMIKLVNIFRVFRAGNVFLVSEKRTVNGVESLPRIGVLYGTAGAWKTSAVRMGDTREIH